MCSLLKAAVKVNTKQFPCLCCGHHIRTQKEAVRCFSDTLGEYIDDEGEPIPLEYLCKASEHGFHLKCSKRSKHRHDTIRKRKIRTSQEPVREEELSDVDVRGEDAMAVDEIIDASPSSSTNAAPSNTLNRQTTAPLTKNSSTLYWSQAPRGIVRSPSRYVPVLSAPPLTSFDMTLLTI